MTYSLPTLTTARLVLRPLTLADAGALYGRIAASRDVFSRWFTWPQTSTLHSVQQNLRDAEEAMAAGSTWDYALLLPSGELVGRVNLFGINHTDRNGELGYWLSQERHGRGLMPEAVRALLGYAFGPGGLHRVYARVDVENEASRHVLRKLGFRHEGTLRHIVRHPQHGWRDQHLYALLADEYHV